jgi:DNA-binding MarR family transcriptional regulator
VATKRRGTDSPQVSWTILSTHGLVLFAIAQDPEIRLRDIALRVGLTERAVQRIVSELIESGYVSRSRAGRRNVYKVHGEKELPHPSTRHQDVGALLDALMSVTPKTS